MRGGVYCLQNIIKGLKHLAYCQLFLFIYGIKDGVHESMMMVKRVDDDDKMRWFFLKG